MMHSLLDDPRLHDFLRSVDGELALARSLTVSKLTKAVVAQINSPPRGFVVTHAQIRVNPWPRTLPYPGTPHTGSH
jgi:hypothetical protein